MNELSNNPYAPLVEDKEDTDETQQEEFHSKLTVDMERVESNPHPTGPVSDNPPSPRIMTTSPEKVMLSRKAQQALRKLQLAKKALLNTSIRAELEEVYGPVELVTQDTKPSQKESSGNKDVEMTNAEAASPASEIWEETSTTGEMDTLTFRRDVLPKGPPKESNPEPRQAAIADLKTRNVSFATTAAGTFNSHNLRRGNLQEPPQATPPNPYCGRPEENFPHTQRPNTATLDKAISLTKSNTRQHIHRYTLRLKTIKAKSEDESHQLIKEGFRLPGFIS
jgi:hypothetical protein